MVSSALVFAGAEPYPWHLARLPGKQLATPDYRFLTAPKGMLNLAGDVHCLGDEVTAVGFEAPFTTRLALLSLRFLPFVGSCHADLWITYGKEQVQIRTLAERFRPGKRHYYQRFGYYAKRLRVRLEPLGHVDRVVWKAKGTAWDYYALRSSLKTRLQEVLQTWKLSWDLEVNHRWYKHNLGLGQCRRHSAQHKHADLVLDAFV